jgi:hypothetical protein
MRLSPLRAGTDNLKVELQPPSARSWSSRFSLLPEQEVSRA